MMASLARFFFHNTKEKSAGSTAAREAIAVSGELIKQMQEKSRSNDPARALMADVWAQRHNVPYVTTMYEANQEMKSGLADRVGNANGDHNDKP